MTIYDAILIQRKISTTQSVQQQGHCESLPDVDLDQYSVHLISSISLHID